MLETEAPQSAQPVDAELVGRETRDKEYTQMAQRLLLLLHLVLNSRGFWNYAIVLACRGKALDATARHPGASATFIVFCENSMNSRDLPPGLSPLL